MYHPIKESDQPINVLVLDNYDSFVYNLVYLLRQFGVATTVVRNDKIGPAEAAKFSHILLSPGPSLPSDAGNMEAIIKHCASTVSILGVCLGHQAIAEVFGSQLFNLEEPLHGVASTCLVQPMAGPFFDLVPQQFQVARYHSWSVREDSLGPDLIVTARDKDNLILGIRHKQFRCWGVQFHPESYLCKQGPKLIEQWLKL
jgi:anthranilate synthase component 2